MTSLESIDISNNNISDFSVLSNLINLTTLGLHRTGIDVSLLSGLTSLKSLNLGSNNISDISVLSNLTSLTYLGLHNNSITDISSLSGLVSLEYLRLDNNSILDISALSSLNSLTRLRLFGNSISDIAPLVANTGLDSGDEVDVRSNPLSDTSLNTHIPALQARGVTVTFGSSKPAVGETEQRMPREVMERFGLEGWEKDGDSFERQ